MKFFPVVLYVAAWVLAITMNAIGQGYLSMELLRYMLLFSVGFQGIYSFFLYYPFHTSVQKEGKNACSCKALLSMATLSYGILGILSFWFSSLWLATTLGVSLFYLGSAYHTLQEFVSKKSEPFPGPVFYLDILVPLTLWLAMLFFYA